MEFRRNRVRYIGHLSQGGRGPADHDGELPELVCVAMRKHFDLFLLLRLPFSHIKLSFILLEYDGMGWVNMHMIERGWDCYDECMTFHSTDKIWNIRL